MAEIFVLLIFREYNALEKQTNFVFNKIIQLDSYQILIRVSTYKVTFSDPKSIERL